MMEGLGALGTTWMVASLVHVHTSTTSAEFLLTLDEKPLRVLLRERPAIGFVTRIFCIHKYLPDFVTKPAMV